MTPDEYRKALLGADTAHPDGAPRSHSGVHRVAHVTRERCAGPSSGAEPLTVARARALREALVRALPEDVQAMDLAEIEAWIAQRRDLEERLERTQVDLESTHTALEEHRTVLQQTRTSPSMRVGRRVLAPARLVLRALRLVRSLPRSLRVHGLRGLPGRLGTNGGDGPAYADWARRHATLSASGRSTLERQLQGLPSQPLISVVTPVYNSDPRFLREAVDSLREQVYPHWELLLVDDASDAPGTRQLLADLEGIDVRVRVLYRDENGHISAASNTGLAHARGEWVGFLDHDDRLAPDALFRVAEVIGDDPRAGLIYSDEDKIRENGERYEPHFKPDWNPDLLRSQNYINHFSVYRRDLVDAAGGLREGFEGAQDYDLVLRVTERLEPRAIRHIPRVLYHWRAVTTSTAHAGETKPYAVEAARRALQEHLERSGRPDAVVLPAPGFEGMWWRVRYGLPDPAPRVSVLIPTRNGLHLLMDSVASVLDEADYPDVELIVIDNASDDPATLRYLDFLRQDDRVKVVRDERPFNFSQLNNDAVPFATGSVLVFLNNDVKAQDRDWLRELVSHALRPEVGVVGARLLFPDDTIQHAGCILGVGGVAAHAYLQLPDDSPGYLGRAGLIQNYSAVTAACVAMRRAVFDEVGGFDAEHLKVAFNDIDLCLKVLQSGYWNVWTPYARLYHFESISRGYEDTPEKQERFRGEIAYMRRQWGDLLDADPAYNPNLSLEDAQFRLARAPRIPDKPHSA
ncbi:glycosyltransferase [Thioalkalivibrio sp. ALE11]|uniref:glycosyltransferase family 2 protein n=1 Tax=Thioalkalivibrio sp. ALE11 TaxID=1265494 RepID=UPI00036EEB67|nr:glycosyltransferase [Thioalkalivibrio sp. ALE11]